MMMIMMMMMMMIMIKLFKQIIKCGENEGMKSSCKTSFAVVA